jgi:cystathionine beta-synthase
MGGGTGGSLTGISRKIKQKLPNCKIVGVDPIGSVLARPSEVNGTPGPWQVEGTGQKFTPRVCCNADTVDYWVKTGDAESFDFARRLIRHEGI